MEKKEVQGILNQPQPGFFKVLVISFLIHAVLLSAGLLLERGERKRIFYTPVYTVDLVSLPPVKQKKKIKKKTPKAAKKPVKVKKRPSKKTLASKKPDKKVYVSEAISKIEKEVQKKEDKTLIASRIEEIKRKSEAEEEELESLRKGIAEEEKLKNRIETLKKEIASSESETKTVEVDSTDRAPAPLLAPGKVTRELFDLEFKAWVYPGTDKGLVTLLSLKIARSGELKQVVFEKRSGNARFDESALRAIKKAAPFPPLPEGLAGEFLELGIRFCPRGCNRLL
jgi:TonB family protein